MSESLGVEEMADESRWVGFDDGEDEERDDGVTEAGPTGTGVCGDVSTSAGDGVGDSDGDGDGCIDDEASIGVLPRLVK
uniref:Uncharacterized protein n=1 Tax=Moniliophthora roreri TaxID=221103 RepID=A0A0W0F6L4_MONRR